VTFSMPWPSDDLTSRPCFRRGDRIDIVARATSRRFGGFESIQLEVLTVAAEGTQVGADGRRW